MSFPGPGPQLSGYSYEALSCDDVCTIDSSISSSRAFPARLTGQAPAFSSRVQVLTK